MSFGGGGGGGGTIASATDVALSNPVNNDVLSYNSSSFKWTNVAIPSGSATFTATKNTATSGAITLTAGSSAQLTKIAATLSAARTITLAGTTANAYFDITMIETDFNGFTITVTNGTFSHVYSYPTYVRYVYIGSAWERVL